MEMFDGCVIAESLVEPSALNRFQVYRAQVTPKEIAAAGTTGRWHMYWLRCRRDEVVALKGELKPGWYANFWRDDVMLIVFRDRVFEVGVGDPSTWGDAVAHGRAAGIVPEQLDFLTEATPRAARWADFEQASPVIAAGGRKLLYQFGLGLAYLATVRKDGGPRLHPICPVFLDGGLYGLIGPSPKRHDLLRDRRYALHSFPAVDFDDEFYLTGRAQHLPDAPLTERVREAFLALGGNSSTTEELFELRIEHALLATYKKRGEPDNWPPRYEVWHAR